MKTGKNKTTQSVLQTACVQRPHCPSSRLEDNHTQTTLAMPHHVMQNKGRAQLHYNGSKCAAPPPHELALTCSSCVKHSMQWLFFATAAHLDLEVCGGDTKDAFAHLPVPEMTHAWKSTMRTPNSMRRHSQKNQPTPCAPCQKSTTRTFCIWQTVGDAHQCHSSVSQTEL